MLYMDSLSKTSNFSVPSNDWWKTACIYQIYPRSFSDSNGDGVGDLNGITSKVGYLKSLGVDAVWLSPCFPSHLYDGGYDVDDYMNIDSRLGTLEDFDRMVDALHANGIRIYVDIVANHTSIHHAWFEEALKAEPGSPARERYIFRNGKGKHGELPPNDWPSHFGPEAWTRVVEPDGSLGQWYYHMFAPQQPDLNWQNLEVREHFKQVLRFWGDRGVDGFRVDVAHGMSKDLSEPFKSKPTISPMTDDDPIFDRDENHVIFREWRQIFNEYNPPLSAVAEANAEKPNRRILYAREDELGQAFNFDLLKSSWDAEKMFDVIDVNVKLAHEYGTASTWVLSNHDKVRHVSRYALPNGTDYKLWLMSDGLDPAPDYTLGEARAKAGTMLMLALPGSAYVYQGEELGLREVADLPHDSLQDPVWVNSGNKFKGRDGCRVPLPWDSSENFGFTSWKPHLPMPEWFEDYIIEKEDSNSDSFLNFYRSIIKLRRSLITSDMFEWLEGSSSGVLHFKRSQDWNVLTNMNSEPIDMPEHSVIYFTSGQIFDNMVPANTTVWYKP